MTDLVTVNYFLVTGLLVGLALVLWYFSKNFGDRLRASRMKQGHGIHIVETAFLSPHQKIHVVDIGGQKYVVTTGRFETSAPVLLTQNFQDVLAQEKNKQQGATKKPPPKKTAKSK